MSTPPKNKPATLLTSQEQTICTKIAAGATPHNQRAAALLALHSGSTQPLAAEQSGLSAGQVKYWVAKFRKQRLGIFPAELLAQLKADAETEQESTPTPVEPVTDELADTKPEKEEKTKKKSKKDKKSKKGKKSKKDKKSKKGKKDKKKKKSKKSGKK